MRDSEESQETSMEDEVDCVPAWEQIQIADTNPDFLVSTGNLDQINMKKIFIHASNKLSSVSGKDCYLVLGITG